MKLTNLFKKNGKTKLEGPFSLDQVFRKKNGIFKFQKEGSKTNYFIQCGGFLYTISSDGSVMSKTEIYGVSGDASFGFYPNLKEAPESKFFYLASKEEATNFFKLEKSLISKLVENPLECAIQDRINYDFNRTLNLFLEKDIENFIKEKEDIKKQPNTKYFVAKTNKYEKIKGGHDLFFGIITNSEKFAERFIKESLIQSEISDLYDPDVYAIPKSCTSAIANIEKSNPIYIEHFLTLNKK